MYIFEPQPRETIDAPPPVHSQRPPLRKTLCSFGVIKLWIVILAAGLAHFLSSLSEVVKPWFSVKVLREI